MTDARLPGRWLMDPTMRTLGADLWTVFSWALMWSAEQGTDGLIPAHMLPLLHPSGATTEHADALLSVGLWDVEGDGYRVRDWDHSQSLAADLERKRELDRERKRRQRAKDPVTQEVTRDGMRESPRLGEERPGEAKDSQSVGTTRETPRRESPDERFRRLMATADGMDRDDSPAISSPAVPATGWPVRAIPE